MHEVKIIGISIETNALGYISGTGKQIPVEDFPLGNPVRLNQWLPDTHLAYVKPIDIIRTKEELKIESQYKTTSVPLRCGNRISIEGIGLSYASCRIDIYCEPE